MTAMTAPPTILIVEDSPVEAELIRRILVKAGYAVTVAGDGEEGLQAARAQHPALVLSDINMPVMNGYQLCRALKFDDTLWNIPVMLLTGLADPKDIIEAINSGADAYIIKPFAESDLLERARSLLDTAIKRRRVDERREEIVDYGGERHSITGGGQQILNLMLSLHENALNQNRETLALQAQFQRLNESLEQQVRERTVALIESEQRYRNIFNGARDGIVLIDADSGLVADCNREFEKQCGRPLAELQRLHIWELRPPEQQAAAQRKFEKIRAVGEGGSNELDFERPNGSRLRIEFVSRRIRLDNGDYLQSICHDITERKRTEAALEQERLRLETILKTASDGIHILDADGLLVDANDAFLNMLGYDRAAIGHLHVIDFDVRLDAEAIRKNIKNLIAQHSTVLIETRQRRSDGSIIDVEVNCRALKIDGQDFIYAASRDVTARRLADAKLLEQIEELRRWHDITSGREKRILSIKHEVNELLAQVGQPPRYPSAETPDPTEEKSSSSPRPLAGEGLGERE